MSTTARFEELEAAGLATLLDAPALESEGMTDTTAAGCLPPEARPMAVRLPPPGRTAVRDRRLASARCGC